MKSSEFLVEWEMSEFDKFISDCSDFYEYTRNPHNYLCRGDRRSPYSDNFIMNSRSVLEGRRPVDTDEVVHDMMNQLFIDKFNLPFRSGMMCSGSISQAAEYGRVFVIVPCNGYTACYSPIYSDMYSQMMNADIIEAASEVSDDNSGNSGKQASSKLRVLLRMAFQHGKYVAGREIIEQAIMSNHEVMLYPESYQSSIDYYAFTENFYATVVIPLINDKRGVK